MRMNIHNDQCKVEKISWIKEELLSYQTYDIICTIKIEMIDSIHKKRQNYHLI